MDKREFHDYLNDLKDEHPDAFGLIESIQSEFDNTVEVIGKNELQSMRSLPVQYIERINQDDGGWTTQLHVWAENGVRELLELEPNILAHKNGYNDTILMSLISGATGLHTEKVDYELIQQILDKDYNYTLIERNKGEETTTECNLLDTKDLNNETIIDYLLNFAYGTGSYDGFPPDIQLQYLLSEFAGYNSDDLDEPEVTIVKVEEPEETPEVTIVKVEEPEETPEVDTNALEEENNSLDITNYTK